MAYYTRDKEGKTTEFPVQIKRSSDYKRCYAHGAQGGILGSYHYRLDFYCDHVPPIEGEEEGGMVEPAENAIIREIDVSVYLPLPFAKQLRDWLDKNIREFEAEHGEINIVGAIEPEGPEEVV